MKFITFLYGLYLIGVALSFYERSGFLPYFAMIIAILGMLTHG